MITVMNYVIIAALLGPLLGPLLAVVLVQWFYWLASTAQQLALSFGVAFGSVVAQAFLQGVPQTDRTAFVRALHHAFVVIDGFTILSSVTFSGLRGSDGSNVSQHRHDPKLEELAEKPA